jgi:hypothetical protein
MVVQLMLEAKPTIKLPECLQEFTALHSIKPY